ncbi:MAG: cupin domain-containing protein, partial [Sphingobacteriales bacterium]
WGDQCDGWHLLQTEGLSVIEERMPPGTSEQLHFHNNARQLFYILSGTAAFEIEGETKSLKKGQSVYIPKSTKHRIFNQSKQDLCFLVISEPKSHGDRVNCSDNPVITVQA